MKIRHPDSARGNDLYETPEVATFSAAARRTTSVDDLGASLRSWRYRSGTS